MTPTCPTLTRLASTIGSVGLSRSNNCRASAAAGPPSRSRPATEESLSRSSEVIVARCAAQAWTESADWVWLSSSGFDPSIRLTSASRF